MESSFGAASAITHEAPDVHKVAGAPFGGGFDLRGAKSRHATCFAGEVVLLLCVGVMYQIVEIHDICEGCS